MEPCVSPHQLYVSTDFCPIKVAIKNAEKMEMLVNKTGVPAFIAIWRQKATSKPNPMAV